MANNIQTLDRARAYDQKKPLYTITPDEQLQVDLWRQFWLYAHPPNDGTDLYSCDQGFFIRRDSVYDTPNGSIAKAKGLRRNTKAIFNFIPNIVATNRQFLANGAEVGGIMIRNEAGEIDEANTEIAQSMLKKQFPNLLAEVLENGLVTGQAYIEIVKEQSGKIFFNCLYSDHVFITRDENDIRKIKKVVIKYSYEDERGMDHSYYREITEETIKVEIDGEIKQDEENPFGFIPVVHIKNLPVPGKVYGDNCFSQHISDIDQLNEMIGDWAYALSLYGHPTPVVEGASVDGELKMDVGQVIELPEGGKVTLLEYAKHDQQLDKILKLAEVIKRKIPEFDLSEIESGAVNLSGYAIQLRLSSIISKINFEQVQYEQGFAHAIELALNVMAGNTAATYQEYDVEFDMGPALPSNIMERITEVEKLKLNGWITDDQAMRKVGLSQSEIDDVEAMKEEDFNFAEQLEKFNSDPGEDEEFVIDSEAKPGDIFKLNRRTGELERR